MSFISTWYGFGTEASSALAPSVCFSWALISPTDARNVETKAQDASFTCSSDARRAHEDAEAKAEAAKARVAEEEAAKETEESAEPAAFKEAEDERGAADVNTG